MPKITPAEMAFAKRLGRVLVELRARAGMTREDVEELGRFPASTLGKWERGDNAPKGFDISRLYGFYKGWGADPAELLEPPRVVERNPVRARLDALERSGAIRADEREARVAARRQRAAAKRGGGPDRPSTDTPLRSVR